jgi:WD40 repeat protein
VVASGDGQPEFRLTVGGEVKVADLWAWDAALADDDTVVMVGSTPGPEEAALDKLGPCGAIVDLKAKRSTPFTNGHTAGIRCVSVSNGRVATTSSFQDPVLRIWDLKAAKTVQEITIDNPGPDSQDYYYATWFHKTDRLAVSVPDRLLVFDPARPDDRTEFKLPDGGEASLHKPAVSVDDSQIASAGLVWPNGSNCPVDRSGLVCWDVATRKATYLSLIPENAPDKEHWYACDTFFHPTGELFAWRYCPEIPRKATLDEVPADRRSVVRVDLRERKVTPLGFEPNELAHCAMDPSGKWLATVGPSRVVVPRPDSTTVLSELRVYHLPSKMMVFREQFDSARPANWVTFSPSGKRLYVNHGGGTVKWWNVEVK